MKKIVTFIMFMLLTLWSIVNIQAEYNPFKPVDKDAPFTTTSANLEDSMNVWLCTMEYAPVCAQPPMPECPEWMMCIQVMPSPKTYWNSCMAWAAKAEIIHKWECMWENDGFIDYSDTSKTMHPSWDLNRDGINDCEVEGTCDHTTDYTKPRTYSNSEDFLKAEWNMCLAATDGCNTVQIWNWALGWMTMMYCEDIYGEKWQEKWSCLAYDERSEAQKKSEEYITKNLNSLVSEDAVLWWTWYVAHFEWIDEKNVEVIAEDWHIQDIFVLNIDNLNSPIREDVIDNMVICTMEYAPVCWVDGVTYWNRCVAEQQNKVEVAYTWECKATNDTLSYVDRELFKKYVESNKQIPELLKYIETKALESASLKLEQKIEATKLQRIARWVQEQRITAFVFLKWLIDREINLR